MTQLHVGVPAALADPPERSGHGTVWRNVLPRLGPRCRVVPDGRMRRGPTGRRRPVDVWLYDGHQGHLGTPGRHVVHVYEAGWHEPQLAALLDPRFLAAIDRQTGDAVARADATIVPSASTRQQIVEHYGIDAGRIHVVPLGVDLLRFNPGAARRTSEVLARAGAEPDRPYVLFVSQLHPRKNLPVLREAMGRLAAGGRPHALVLVGDPPADRTDGDAIVAELTAELPGLPGRLFRVDQPTDDDLAALMAGADALCLPSLMEGFGMTPLEAMACGTPVVVSNRGSLPEVVGRVGTIVTPTVEGVTAGLDALLDLDPETRLDQRVEARRWAERFTWDATAAGWRHVLEVIAGAPVA